MRPCGARDRLGVLRDSSDGFEIARRDLKLAIMDYFKNSQLYEAYGSTEAGIVTGVHGSIKAIHVRVEDGVLDADEPEVGPVELLLHGDHRLDVAVVAVARCTSQPVASRYWCATRFR